MLFLRKHFVKPHYDFVVLLLLLGKIKDVDFETLNGWDHFLIQLAVLLVLSVPLEVVPDAFSF